MRKSCRILIIDRQVPAQVADQLWTRRNMYVDQSLTGNPEPVKDGDCAAIAPRLRRDFVIDVI
jgi:hypothetical protein